MPDELMMTPGPTQLPPDVQAAMDRPIHNPDVQPEFTAFYRDLLAKLSRVYRTDDDVVVLGGEGILGLEAATESLIEAGDTVLCLANGVYGEGFAEFVEMAGGEPVVHSVPADSGFDPEAVKDRLEADTFDAATMVHCETPTGVLNDLDEILGLLADAGVLTIVDAVSSLGGAPVPVERIDVCLGASQKCFSSPPGLTTLSVSDRAWERVEQVEPDSFYTSLEPWRDPDLGSGGATLLPYTHLVSNLYALEASLDRILQEGVEAVHERHAHVAQQCRERGQELGLEPFAGPQLSSPTVTAFEVPGRAEEHKAQLDSEHDVIVATSLGEYADDILRIGHMGYNADVERVERTMDALAAVLN